LNPNYNKSCCRECGLVCYHKTRVAKTFIEIEQLHAKEKLIIYKDLVSNVQGEVYLKIFHKLSEKKERLLEMIVRLPLQVRSPQTKSVSIKKCLFTGLYT
jgi:hypothetical protein